MVNVRSIYITCTNSWLHFLSVCPWNQLRFCADLPSLIAFCLSATFMWQRVRVCVGVVYHDLLTATHFTCQHNIIALEQWTHSSGNIASGGIVHEYLMRRNCRENGESGIVVMKGCTKKSQFQKF